MYKLNFVKTYSFYQRHSIKSDLNNDFINVIQYSSYNTDRDDITLQITSHFFIYDLARLLVQITHATCNVMQIRMKESKSSTEDVVSHVTLWVSAVSIIFMTSG